MTVRKTSEHAPPRGWLARVLAGIPPHRALISDLLTLQREMPIVSQSREFDLAELRDLRGALPRRISWSVLFLRAYAITSKQRPALRRTWMKWPWAHLYEHPSVVGNVAISRTFRGEEWLFFAPLAGADTRELSWLQGLLEKYQQQPVEVVFRTQLRLAHFPPFVRKVLWWLRLHVSARKRIKRLGTFGMTTLAGNGVTILDPKAPVTTTLSYGPLDDQGRCRVTISYDHRVMDGKEIAATLEQLEQVLQSTIADELRPVARQGAARQAAA